MSSFFRSIGSRLQTSSTARLVLYGTAATATSIVTWNYHAQSRREREKLMVERKKVAAVHPKVEQSPRPPPMLDTQHKSPHTDDRNAKSSQTPGDVPVDFEKQDQEQDQGQESEAEAANTGAFDPVTGEINWDCPCLGGMAHGPCGPQFRAAFSCFVYSEAEPKGVDCVEKFRDMQDCFRAHPDVYAEELRDDDEPIDDDTDDSSNSGLSGPSSPSSTAGGEGLEPPSISTDGPKPKPPAKPTPKPPTGEDKLPHSPPPLPPSEPIKGPPALPPNPMPKPPTIIDPPAGPITSLPGATATASTSESS